MAALPPYVGPLGRAWHYGFYLLCALVLLFLITPILVIIPLSFNAEPYFTYPMPGLSLRWYQDFWQSDMWGRAVRNSVIIGVCATILATTLGTLAALGLSKPGLPVQGPGHGRADLADHRAAGDHRGRHVFFLRQASGLRQHAARRDPRPHALGTPFVVITVTATLAGFDHSLVRAAPASARSPARTFFKVLMPLILPGVISGALFAFVTSFDEVVVVLFLASVEQRTIPRQMWSGIREMISPTIIAAATILIVISILLLATLELLRRRNERLRGIRPTLLSLYYEWR